MAVEERERRELQEGLMEAIGSDNTDTLLSYLPPVGWADVATKRDLDALRNELRGEIAELRGEMHEGFAILRTEVGHQGQTLFYRILMLQVAMLAVVVALVSTGLLN